MILVEEHGSADGDVMLDPTQSRFELRVIASECDPGVAGELAAEAAAQSWFPAYYRGLPFQGYSREAIGPDSIRFTGKYSAREPATPDSFSTTFQTRLETSHITHSLSTIANYERAGTIAPDFKKAINVEKDKIHGLDIDIPTFEWSEQHKIPKALMTLDYRKLLFALTGSVNRDSFRGLDGGQVRFMGVEGNLKGDFWDLTFSFKGSSNAVNIDVGNGIVIDEKLGWDFAWVLYEEVEDETANFIVQRPKAAYVERVYEFTDFGLLGIGTLPFD